MENKPEATTEQSNDTILAALDLGSNSFHMVIARIVQGSLQILSRHKEKVRQAAGLNADQLLDEASMQRGLESLARFNERLQPFAQAQVRIVATYTLRQARNARDFLTRAEQVLAHPVEVISGHEEARLIFQAVAHSESTQGNTLVIDIGGGSSELIIGNQFDVQQLTSRSMGCVSFTRKFFAEGMTKSSFKKAILAAEQELESIVKPFCKLGWQSALATSGTAKALATCAQELGFQSISAESLQALQKCMIQQKGELAIKGINPDRVQVLAGGLAVMQAIVKSLGIEAMQYSSAALREGVLYEMHGGMEHDNVRQRTRESLQARYNVDLSQAKNVAETARWLWLQLKADWNLAKPTLNLLKHAAHLHEVGLDINSSTIQRHSAYILEHSDLPGYNLDEQLVLANLVRFHRKRLHLEQLLPIESLMKSKSLVRLIRILRIAVLLNIGRHGCPQLQQASADGKNMSLQFEPNFLIENQLLQADLERESHWLSAVDLQLKFG